MKTRKRAVTIAVLVLMGIALVTLPSVAAKGRSAGRGMRGGMGMGPAFTQEQLDKIEKIHDKYADQRAELTNRLKVLRLEGKDLVEADSPDFNAIESKIEEISKVKLDLVKLRLTIHKEIRPLLDDDQKTLFDRGIGRLLGGWGGMDHGRMGHMDGRGMSGGRCMMGGPGMRGGHAAMGGPGMMGGGCMMGGPGMGGSDELPPWCPRADTDDDSDE
jgi:Spy/CpxP family protein refolding chaperone